MRSSGAIAPSSAAAASVGPYWRMAITCRPARFCGNRDSSTRSPISGRRAFKVISSAARAAAEPSEAADTTITA
jgi:hypothetical protein